jgi:hypothetical protein
MNIIKNTKPRLSVQDAAECLGLKTYDTAIPQPWIDNVLLMMSLTAVSKYFVEDWKYIVLSGLVWCYDKTEDGLPSIFGYPVALTKKCLDLLVLACPGSIWDFSQQKAVIENRETFIIEGIVTVLDSIKADTQEQAEMLFRATYPAAKITAVKVKDEFNHIAYTKNQPKE